MVSRVRDGLPVPLSPDPGSRPRLSRGTRQRIGRRNAVECRRCDALGALSDVYGSQDTDLSDCLNSGMSNGSDRILEAFQSFDPTLCETTEEALKVLLGSSVPYDGHEESTTLASFDRGKVALPGVFTEPSNISDLLGSRARTMVESFQTELLHDAEHFARVIKEEGKVKPYLDPALTKSRSEYELFISDLYAQKIIGFTSDENIIERCGMFFVTNNDGTLRLVIDARPANQHFRPSPNMPIGGGSAWASIRIPTKADLHVGQYYVQSYFYRCGIDSSLGYYFGLPAVSFGLLERLGVDTSTFTSAPRPYLEVLPMGFSWSMWLAQRLHVQVCLDASGLDSSRVLCEGRPAPLLTMVPL